MSAFATLALQNNAAATVNFVPLAIDVTTGVANYATADAVYDAKSFITISTRMPSKNSSKAKMRLKVTVPIMDSIDVTKKVDEAICQVEISYPKNMGLTPRLDVRKYVDTLLQNAVVTAFATSFEGIY